MRNISMVNSVELPPYSSQVRSFVTYSVYMEILMAYSVHIPTRADIFYK